MIVITPGIVCAFVGIILVCVALFKFDDYLSRHYEKATSEDVAKVMIVLFVVWMIIQFI